MKTIGLIGGMSWESTLHYYQQLNQGVNQNLGGLHSAKIIMESVDFHPLEEMMRRDDWPGIGKQLILAARRIEQSGADCLLICTNTMHKVAESVQNHIDIPLLHIADATGQKIVSEQLTTVGLLGTRFTMEEDFYRVRLEKSFNLKVIIPPEPDRVLVNNVIFSELCHGKVNEQSREDYLRIMATMHQDGAEAIIEGCTEINMLVNDSHSKLPLFDTTTIHVESALEFALA